MRVLIGSIMCVVMQATASDIEIIYDVCWMLSPSQIQRMCSNYFVADYEVRFYFVCSAMSTLMPWFFVAESDFARNLEGGRVQGPAE